MTVPALSRSLLPALAAGLVVTACPALAQTTNNPIPGVDIIVQKDHGGGALTVGQTGRDGWFTGTVRVQSAEYSVRAACPPHRTCPAFRLASVTVDGRPVSPDAGGLHRFPVGASGGVSVTLRALVVGQSTATPR